MQMLEAFFDSMKLQFQPHDAPEQCMLKWVTLKQTGSVAEHMNQVDQLYNIWRLCQKAEFGLAMLKLKSELKGVIRHSMLGRRSKWTLLRELRDLAMSAEVEKFDPLPVDTFATKKKKGDKNKSKGDASILALIIGGWELKDPHKDP